jgi:methyl-accepting chemotaxis protein
MGQMDKVTQANASAAEESASAAEELSSQASQLSDVVAEFKIARNGKGDNKGMSDMFSGNDISLLRQLLNQSKTMQHGVGYERKPAGVGAAKSRNGGNGKKKGEIVIPMDDEDYSNF